jgi:hypothetical protein
MENKSEAGGAVHAVMHFCEHVELFLLLGTPCFITLPLFSRLSYR